ncbi:MAG: hypothetical protein LH615_01635, partial [Ferruginibacter sp.]|nr:hypothetical protein [Ferruginibacter sp.]
MSIIKKLRKVIISLLQYTRASIDIKARSTQSNDIEIYIYLQEKDVYYEDQGRYLYLLLRFLTFTKSKVALVEKITFKDYRNLGVYGKRIYELDNLVLATKLPEKTDDKIFIHDQAISKWTSKIWKKIIRIEFDISLPVPQDDNWAFMPYPMHPSIYSGGQYSEIKNLQNIPKKLRLLFAGNADPRFYSNTDPQSILGKFKIVPRTTVIETITSHLAEEILAVKDWQHMELLFNSNYKQKCIVVDTNKSKFEVPQAKWLEIVAKSDFFLCAAGVTIPLCHNAIESMAVGTIPVTNYPDWFFPSLEHLKNCIRFTTKEDLIETIKFVLSMDKSQIEQLRKNVLEYYPSSVRLRKLWSFLNPRSLLE